MEPVKVISPDLVVVDWGPMTLSIRAWARGRPRPVIAAKAGSLALTLLADLADFQQYMKRPALDLPRRGRRPAVVARALEACRAVALAGGTSLTPLAAVAGAVADEIAEAAQALGADRVVVNNGGDLALRLAPRRRLLIGLPLRPGGPLAYRLRIIGGDGIGGVATSGWQGRSFSPGVAEQVVVWGASGALADAAATALAGACLISSPRVRQQPAGELDPSTDVPGLMVTVKVGKLSEDEACQALAGGQTMALRLAAKLPIAGAHFSVAGRTLLVEKTPGTGRLLPLR